MTDFVIVIAAIAAVASAAPGGGSGAPVAVPDRQPTVGFHTYPSLEACERAAGHLVPPAASRLVCLPVEPPPGGLADAY